MASAASHSSPAALTYVFGIASSRTGPTCVLRGPRPVRTDSDRLRISQLSSLTAATTHKERKRTQPRTPANK